EVGVVAGADPPAPGAGRARTGAGCSASAPFTDSSIQATCLPSLYVWITLNVIDSALGSGPAEMENSPYSPASIPAAAPAAAPAAVHSTVLTASVIWSPSSVVTGVASFVVVSLCVQPGTGSTDTAATPWSTGICTVTFVVAALSLSSGTRNV